MICFLKKPCVRSSQRDDAAELSEEISVLCCRRGRKARNRLVRGNFVASRWLRREVVDDDIGTDSACGACMMSRNLASNVGNGNIRPARLLGHFTFCSLGRLNNWGQRQAGLELIDSCIGSDDGIWSD